MNFRFYNNNYIKSNNFIYVSSDLAPCKDRALIGDTAIFYTPSLQIQLLDNSTALQVKQVGIIAGSFKDCEVILKVTFSFPLVNCCWDRKWPREHETGIKD